MGGMILFGLLVVAFTAGNALCWVSLRQTKTVIVAEVALLAYTLAWLLLLYRPVMDIGRHM